MSEAVVDAGSFRDPSGRVFEHEGHIYRTVHEFGRTAYETVRGAEVVERLIADGSLISAKEVERQSWPADIGGSAYLLEHPVVPFISHPYEWSFNQLKAAALHHLDLQIALLQQEIVLSDASAYNIQFIGPRPLFIDFLSLRPYRKGEYWQGHRQFCEQFLNPLLLRALMGVPHNAWFRGSLEGIPTEQLASLLPISKRLSWNVLSQIVLQAKLEQKALNAPDASVKKLKAGRQFSIGAYNGFLLQLRNWISKLRPGGKGKTVWGDYASSHTYTDDEAKAKWEAIRVFASSTHPELLVDLGCNTGDYSVAALKGGAKYVVGFDFDQNAVDLAFSRAVSENLNFLPLWQDAANPSPNQGWWQKERRGFSERAGADAMIALAFEHHLAIGRNVPLVELVDWLLQVAPKGIIEFVPKTDSTVQKMLALREDIFPNYTEEEFEKSIAGRARIVRKTMISGSGRVLFQFDRSEN